MLLLDYCNKYLIEAFFIPSCEYYTIILLTALFAKNFKLNYFYHSCKDVQIKSLFRHTATIITIFL